MGWFPQASLRDLISKASMDSGEPGYSLPCFPGMVGLKTLVQRQGLISGEHSTGHLQLGGIPKDDI